MPPTVSTLRIGLVLLALASVGAIGTIGTIAPAVAAEKPTVTVSAVAVPVAEDTLRILWRLQCTAGWHVYADLRNDAGYPPSVKLELPAGWSSGPLQWPAAERHVAAGEILDHVFHDQVTILQDVTIASGALLEGPVTIPARWDWLACREMCVPGHTSAEVSFAMQLPAPDVAEDLAAAEAALPQPAPADRLRVTWNEGTAELTVPGAVALQFLPAADCALLVDPIADGQAAGDTLRLRLRPGADGFGPVRGLVRYELRDGRSNSWTVDFPYGG